MEAARRFLKARDSGSAEDMTQALAWADENPAHAVAFARAEASWDFAERLRGVRPDALATASFATAGFATAGFATDSATADPPASAAAWISARVGRRGFAGLIAATILALLATTTIQLLGAVDRYRTRLGEERVVRLADGSVLHLNTDTSVEVALGDDRRDIALLKGEARFDVAHDPRRPFLVTAGGSTVRAVGTAFSIRLRDDLTELMVIEGAVAVRDGPSAPRRVGAGAGAAIRDGTIAVTPLALADVRQRLAWQSGLIEFEGETLDQAVAEFNRYRKSPLVLGDPQLASIRIGGTFSADGSDAFVAALEAGFGIRAIVGRDHAIVLMPGSRAALAD